jgi:hypothetical protein
MAAVGGTSSLRTLALLRVLARMPSQLPAPAQLNAIGRHWQDLGLATDDLCQATHEALAAGWAQAQPTTEGYLLLLSQSGRRRSSLWRAPLHRVPALLVAYLRLGWARARHARLFNARSAPGLPEATESSRAQGAREFLSYPPRAARYRDSD